MTGVQTCALPICRDPIRVVQAQKLLRKTGKSGAKVAKKASVKVADEEGEEEGEEGGEEEGEEEDEESGWGGW